MWFYMTPDFFQNSPELMVQIRSALEMFPFLMAISVALAAGYLLQRMNCERYIRKTLLEKNVASCSDMPVAEPEARTSCSSVSKHVKAGIDWRQDLF